MNGTNVKPVRELFIYTFNPFLAMATNTTQENNINIDGDADFLLTDIFGIAFDSATGLTKVDFYLQLRDDTSSKNYFSRNTYSRLACSNAEAINPLSINRMIKSKSAVTVTVTHLNAAATSIYIALRGYKVPINSAPNIL